MASIVAPVPNQPVYVWQPSLSAINMRGSVVGTATLLPVYGSVITGTQSIMYIPVRYTELDHRGRVYVHGFHLPVQSILGATRFRIPLIVRIWNYVLTGINVIATVITANDRVEVIANSSHTTGDMYHAYMHMGGIETTDWLKLCFTITGIKRLIFTMFNHTYTLKQGVKLRVSTLLRDIINKVRISANILQVKTHFTLMVSNVLDEIIRKFNMQARVRNQDHVRIAKMLAKAATVDLLDSITLHVRLWSVELKALFKASAKIVEPHLEAMFKLSVDLTGKFLTGIMSYIQFLLEGYDVEHTIGVHSTASQNVQNMKNMIHVEAQTHKKEVAVRAHAVRRDIKENIWTIIQLTSSAFQKLLSFSLIRSIKNTALHIWGAPEKIERILDVHTKAEQFRAKTTLFIHTEQFRAEEVLLEINPISWLGEVYVKFNPDNLPRASRINVMITVCETWILAYLNFVPDELLGEINVRMSTCSHEMSSIIQWFIHGGRISNYEKSNEVIFDLGDVDPIGPIPPVPSRQWQGGWVEDPFKGVGYVPADNSTGYGSPSVQDWLSNVQMYWNNASDPFTGGDDTGA